MNCIYRGYNYAVIWLYDMAGIVSFLANRKFLKIQSEVLSSGKMDFVCYILQSLQFNRKIIRWKNVNVQALTEVILCLYTTTRRRGRLKMK